MRVKTIARHARSADVSRGPARQRGEFPRTWHQGTPVPAAGPGQVRGDPLSGPIAITERPVLGDQIRRPIVWCEIGSCIGRYEDPEALGEADVRARAIGAGWRHDAGGRLACPACLQRCPDVWPGYPVVPRARTLAGDYRQREGYARAGAAGGVLASMVSRAGGFGAGRPAMLWRRLLASLTADGSGRDTSRRIVAGHPVGRGHRAGSAGHRRSRHQDARALREDVPQPGDPQDPQDHRARNIRSRVRK